MCSTYLLSTLIIDIDRDLDRSLSHVVHVFIDLQSIPCLTNLGFLWELCHVLTLAMRVPSYDGFDVVVLSADTVI